MDENLSIAILLLFQLYGALTLANDRELMPNRIQIPNELSALKPENLTSRDRLRWRETLQWSEECEKGVSHYGDDFVGLHFYPLPNQKYLVRVTCSLGAYQGSQIFFLIDEKSGKSPAQLLSFEQIFEIEPESTDNLSDLSLKKEMNSPFRRFIDSFMWGTITVAHNHFQMTNLNRYRGSGGCGTQTRYDIGQIPPKIIEFRAKIECTTENIAPDKWQSYSLEQLAQWKIGTNPLRK